MERVGGWIARNWRWLVLLFWIGCAAWFLYSRWRGILIFQLNDTDDNLRMAQVRAWLAGQDWSDLRQYRLDPPEGADIHWSRLVDLPLAALITAGKWFTSGANAERFGIAVAPLLPYLPLIGALALTVRRLVHPAAFPLAFVALFFAGSTNGMFMPTRIDHHGWQLAMLAIAVAGLVDPRPRRGGLVTGLATAGSLAIGLEMLIYLAIAGAGQVLMWVDDREERGRLATYGVATAGGTALGYLVFASIANREAVCDALSPVWLADAMLGGALLLLVAWLSPARWTMRLALAAGAGLALAAFHALAWPHCLSRLEGVSPEVQRLWLDNVREAKPIYDHNWRTIVNTVTLPAAGVLGWLLLLWRNRGVDRDLFRRTLSAAAIALAAAALLLWQTRAGPAAQMLGVTGAVALIWVLAPLAWRSKNPVAAVVGVSTAFVLGLGAAAPLALGFFPAQPPSESQRKVNLANARCPSLAAMRPVALQPRGKVFTFVDLGPRLIAVTHHSAIAGPYHRNGPAIADSMKAFLGTPEEARAIIRRHRADYLLICPMMSQATIFMSRAPNGFYAQLQRGRVPGWLQEVPLGPGSPLRMWRVLPQAPSGSALPPRPDSRG